MMLLDVILVGLLFPYRMQAKEHCAERLDMHLESRALRMRVETLALFIMGGNTFFTFSDTDVSHYIER